MVAAKNEAGIYGDVAGSRVAKTHNNFFNWWDVVKHVVNNCETYG